MGLFDAFFDGAIACMDFIEKMSGKSEQNRIQLEKEKDLKQKATDIINSYGEKCLFFGYDSERCLFLTNKRVYSYKYRYDREELVEMLYDDIDYVRIEAKANRVYINDKKGDSIGFSGYAPMSKEDFKKLIEKYAGRDLTRYVKVGNRRGYVNFCWNCKADIDSDVNKRCPVCRMFICSRCGSCFCNKINK